MRYLNRGDIRRVLPRRAAGLQRLIGCRAIESLRADDIAEGLDKCFQNGIGEGVFHG